MPAVPEECRFPRPRDHLDVATLNTVEPPIVD
jgi:hypothetical protein